MMPFQEHGNSIGSKLFCPAEAVKNCRMQIPTLWECLEVFQLRKRIGPREILDSIGRGLCARVGLRCKCEIAEAFDYSFKSMFAT